MESLAGIQKLIENSNLPHGLLLTGNALKVAEGLAREILNTQKLETNPDYIFIQSEKVEDVKKLLSVLSLRSFGKRVVVISRAENITPQAVNLLLKKIEEPSDETYFIVLTSHEEKILPTLRSRLMAFRFEGASEVHSPEAQEFLAAPDLTGKLKLVKSIDPHEADLISFLKYLYQKEINNLSPDSARRLQGILRSFEYLEANVNANRVLASLAIKWQG